MNKVIFRYLILLLLASVGMANASLTVVGDDYVYDDVAEIWWWADLRTFTNDGDVLSNTFEDQINYITEMAGTWEMATLVQIESLAANSGQDIVDSFISPDLIGGVDFFLGRYDRVFDSTHHYYAVITDSAGSLSQFTYNTPLSDGPTDNILPSAWVYTATNPVPIPGAVWLLGSGLIGLAGLRKGILK